VISRAGLLLLALSVTGCDLLVPEREDSPLDRYVVESYQIAGEKIKPVRLMETVGAADTFNVAERGVAGARAEIQLLGPENRIETRYAFESAPDGTAGIYVPADTTAVIKPGHTYRLRIIPVEGDTVITATTTVPDTFSVLRSNPDSVRYDRGEALGIRVTESVTPDRQSYYLINNIPREVGPQQLTSAGEDLIKGTESLVTISREGYTLQSLRQNEWPITNERSYPHHGDGTLTIQFPWVSVLFLGRNRLDIHVLDTNLYDFIRSSSAQKGGPSPGQIPNVIDHMNGATGVFASMATGQYRVVLLPMN
jgi:hypothetical protein